jgi:Ca2+-binding RTX toxin-like protein
MIMGGEDNDCIFGNEGDDNLQGGNGNDNLIGGWGADTFECGVGDLDIVVDFNKSQGDLIKADCETVKSQI